jgi:hypothetical protein
LIYDEYRSKKQKKEGMEMKEYTGFVTVHGTIIDVLPDGVVFQVERKGKQEPKPEEDTRFISDNIMEQMEAAGNRGKVVMEVRKANILGIIEVRNFDLVYNFEIGNTIGRVVNSTSAFEYFAKK